MCCLFMCVCHSAHLELDYQEVILSLTFLLCVIKLHLCRSVCIWSAASNYYIILHRLWLLIFPVSPPAIDTQVASNSLSLQIAQ